MKGTKIFKKGDKVVYNGTTNLSGNSNLYNGTVLVINSCNNGNGYTQYGGYYIVRFEDGKSAGSVYGNEIKLYALTKAQIQEEIDSLEKEKASLQEKLSIMKAYEMDIYDENTIKVYQTLSIIDKKGTSKIDKAKAIAKLINES
jgi:hypothetical protein